MRKTSNKRNIFIMIVIILLLIGAKLFAPDYFFNVGMKSFEKKDYENANVNFHKALMLSPSNEDFRYYYLQTLAKFKPTYEIQKKMFQFANDEYNDSAHVFAGIQVNSWRDNLMRMYGSNYIEQVPMNSTIIRWNIATFPLKVYIGSKKDLQVPEYYISSVMKAFGQWTSSSGFLKFNFMDNPDNADILVAFDELPNACDERGCKYVVGHTEPVYRGNVLKRMIITIYDKDANGSYFSDMELYNTILHEIGHALGVMGHSYSTNDLMYMGNQVGATNPLLIKYRSDFQYISYQDINTIRLLYNLVPDITNVPVDEKSLDKLIYPPIVLGNSTTIAKRKLKEAKEYVLQAPDLPNGYIELGIAYEGLDKVNKAAEAFTTAFNKSKTDNDRYISLYNLAAMYLNRNNQKLALDYAKQAQKIIDTDDIRELIGNIEHAATTKSKPFWSDFMK